MSGCPMGMGKDRLEVAGVFRNYSPGQGQLPMHLDDVIGEDDLVRVVHEVVERLDISGILDAIKARRKKSLVRGEPAYHPRLMLKLLFYGYCTGTFSSRKLAAQTRTLIPMMWLAGTEHPDFRTISDFRKEHLKAIAKLFVQFLQLARELGMVKLGHVAIDGSKFKANASKYKNLSKERLEEQIPKLRAEVDRLLQQATVADQAEDAEYGSQEGAALPDKLKAKEARLARLEEALAKLKEQQDNGERSKRTDAEKHSINPTDCDSRIMSRRGGGNVQGYNAQIGVDGESGVIVGATLSNSSVDIQQLIPTLDAIEEATGSKPEKVSADTGYFSGDNIAELNERTIDGYIADDTTETKRETDPFSKDHFAYAEDQDAYRCPQGQLLSFKGTYQLPDGRLQRRYWNFAACKTCPVHDLCTKAKHRVIARDVHEPERAAMRAKLKTPDGKQTYSRRKAIVEPAWGQIKQAMGFRQVSLRGIQAVQAEFQLVCAAFNLRKIAAKLRKSPELWLAVRNWKPATGV